MAALARTLCLSLFVLLCLAHTALSLAIPAHGRFRDPTPSSPTSDVSVTTLQARNLAGEKTLVQRATVSPGGNGGNHGLIVRGEIPKDTPSIRPAVMVKRYNWNNFRSVRMSVSFGAKHSKGSNGGATTTISDDDYARLAGRPGQGRQKKTINYDALRHA